MDENNSSEPSPNPAMERDNVDVNSKTFEVLKNDGIDGMSVENSYCDAHSDILLNEASKIVQIGMEKDLIIWEKNKIIQDAMETIETMKKNIYHIQMEYEKLDQNYNKEISNSAEAVKRMDVTKDMIESALHYSNILATSIKQLEDDKFKIAEFYNEIQIRQEEEEEKRKKIESILKEQEDFTKNSVSKLVAEKEKTEDKLKMLMNDLSQVENQLRCELDIKKELKVEHEKCKDELNEMRTTLAQEQTDRIKCQVIQSQLKKKILHQKAKNEKNLHAHKILYKRKLSLLKFKVKDFQEKLDASAESISNYLSIIKDLDTKVVDLNENLRKAREYHGKEVKELEEKLKICLAEKANLDDFIRITEQEKFEEDMKIKALTEENVNLVNMQETIRANLLEKQNQSDKLLKENLNLESQLQELSLEINCKIQKINKLEAEIRSYNAEELAEKIGIYQQKLEKCEKVERELRNEISLLKETLSKERSENEKIVMQEHTTIQLLKKEVLELHEQNEALEKKLNENNSEYTHMKNELSLKRSDLEKITQEFESKMRVVSNSRELAEEYKTNLEKEKLQNKELLQQLQKLEDEKAILDRDFMNALERERSLNEILEKEKENAEKRIGKLNQDIEQGERLLKSQQDKLSRAESEILDMEKLSEKLKASEDTIMNLKKSLESAEANVEAYKIVIQKLEGESAKRKNVENETIKKLQLEISQLKHVNPKTENFSTRLETPKRRNGRGLFKDESENIGSTLKKTPTSTRRLLSTPNRLLGSPYPSPNFKSISPIIKPHDPYEYDSDSSLEQLNSHEIKNDHHAAPKKSIFTSKRKK